MPSTPPRPCQAPQLPAGPLCRALLRLFPCLTLGFVPLLLLTSPTSRSPPGQLAPRKLHGNFPFDPRSLHGSPLTDAGLALLNPALSIHPSLVALDLGDCMLGDEGINLICGLLPPDGAKSGKHQEPWAAQEPAELFHAAVNPQPWEQQAL